MSEFICRDILISLEQQQLLHSAGRFVMKLVIAANVIGVGGDWAAAVLFYQQADQNVLASKSFSVNATELATKYISRSSDLHNEALKGMAVQHFVEMFVCLVIIACFIVMGFMCVRVLRKAGILGSILRKEADRLRAAPQVVAAVDVAIDSGRDIEKRILVTVSVVFLTFLLRATCVVVLLTLGSLACNASADTQQSCS
jgi:hypothetical protein